MIREFHLSPPGKGGISCGKDGAFVGFVPMLHRLHAGGKDEWRPRDSAEISEEMSAQYGLPIDMSPKAGGLRVIAKALNQGDVARAQIATVLLGIPNPLPLSKDAPSGPQLIKLIGDLDWSGMLKWDEDAHPRWPAGSSDGRGGEFAPKDIGTGASFASQSYDWDTSVQSTRTQLANTGMGFGGPILLAAAEIEDERDPRRGIGDNRSPLDELIPQQLVQSPLGPVVQFLDNMLDLTGPADEADLDLSVVHMRALLDAIHAVDPNYVYEGLEPPGGLAGMSWQGRENVINGLQADLAAAIYRVRGDIRPLQEVTLQFMQRTANDAYDEAVKKYNNGELDFSLSQEATIGRDIDSAVRIQLNNFYNNLGISTGPESAIRVNRRAYDTSDPPPSYRVPDARVGNFIFDTSLEAKKPSKGQIRDFFNADFAPAGVVIVRPNQLGSNSSYIIWRGDGD